MMNQSAIIIIRKIRKEFNGIMYLFIKYDVFYKGSSPRLILTSEESEEQL